MMAGKSFANLMTSAANLKRVQLSSETLIVQVQYAASPRWQVGPECYRWGERCVRFVRASEKKNAEPLPSAFCP